MTKPITREELLELIGSGNYDAVEKANVSQIENFDAVFEMRGDFNGNLSG